MIIFNGSEYFYDWEGSTETLLIYDLKHREIASMKASGFAREQKSLKELVVLTIIEAVVKKQEAEQSLKNLF